MLFTECLSYSPNVVILLFLERLCYSLNVCVIVSCCCYTVNVFILCIFPFFTEWLYYSLNVDILRVLLLFSECQYSVNIYVMLWNLFYYLNVLVVLWMSVLLSYRVLKAYITRVGTLIVAIIYLQLIENRYMFRSFTVLQCSHQHCVQPVASDVEVVGYL